MLLSVTPGTLEGSVFQLFATCPSPEPHLRTPSSHLCAVSSSVTCFCAAGLNRLSVYRSPALVFLIKSSRGKNVWGCVKIWWTGQQILKDTHQLVPITLPHCLLHKSQPLTFEPVERKCCSHLGLQVSFQLQVPLYPRDLLFFSLS